MKSPVPWIAALATLCLHLAGNPHYGFFRDELYFIICGFHPQFGYVDQPPVAPLLAALTQLGGHSLFLLRAVPALCAAGGIYVTTLLVAEFGGGLFAQVLAAIAFTGAPVLVAFGTKVSPDETGLFLWPLIALWLVRLSRGVDPRLAPGAEPRLAYGAEARLASGGDPRLVPGRDPQLPPGGNPRLWLAIGTAAGIAAESKYSVLFYLVALLAGLLATPQRGILRSWWALAGTPLGALIVLPNFLWQAVHGFPMWELLEAGQHGKNVIVGPLVYVIQEFAITNLYLAPLWIIGVVWLFRNPPYRFLGIAYVVLILEMIVLHGKHYYPADVYPIVIAAGAVPVAAWTSRFMTARMAVRSAVIAYAAAFAIVLLPLELPVLGETQLLSFERKVVAPLYPIPGAMLATEHNDTPAIGSDYADMHGWPEFAAAVRAAYDALPPGQRAHAVVLATNYGDASALRFFAPEIPTISVHNQYWLWGYGQNSGDVILEIGGTCWRDEHYYAHASTAAHYDTTLPVMGYENHLTFLTCSGLRVPMSALWSDSKNYN